MSAPHTPGPWHLHADGRTILSNQSHPVATLSDPDQRQVETRRGAIVTGNDGPLIAAAPDLYEALAQAAKYLRGGAPVEMALDTIDAAIAKAEGRTP